MNAILPQGTAYITDVGMVGPQGRRARHGKEAVLHKFLTQLAARFVVDEGKWHFHARFDGNRRSKRAVRSSIQLIRLIEDRIMFA